VYTSLTSEVARLLHWKTARCEERRIESWKPQIWLPRHWGRRESGGAVTQNDWYADGGRAVKAAMKFPKGCGA